METQDSIKQKIKKDIKDEIDKISNYSEKKNQCSQLLSNIVFQREKNEIDDQTINVLYGEIPGEIFGLTEAYFSILISGWNLLSKIQVDTNTHVYRAGIAAFLAMNYRMRGDRGATFRWALLTQAEDLLSEHPQDGGTGKDLLTSEFGFDGIALGKLKDICRTNFDSVSKKRIWTIPEAFSEDIITRFAFMFPEYSLKFALNTNLSEYDINPYYLTSLINRLNEKVSNTTEKGNSLEQLATYLFLLIPGLVPRRNLLDETLAFESDIVVRNLNNNSNLVSDMFGRFILSECKNWENRVGVKDVGYFLYRMRLTHSHFGILFAKEGITGDSDGETAARSLIRKAFHEDGNICVAIDNTLLNSICQKSISFLSCLVSENEKVRFGTEKKT